MSRFNLDPSEGLLSYCVEELRKRGVSGDNALIVTVPGVLEIPLALYRMASGCRFHALIALGAVIRGETYHYEVLANGVCSWNRQRATGYPGAGCQRGDRNRRRRSSHCAN